MGSIRQDVDKVKGELKRSEQSLRDAAEVNKKTAEVLHTEIEKSLLRFVLPLK